MFKAAVIAALGSCTAFLVSAPAQAQVVTSYYAPYTAYSVPTVAPAVVAPAVAASPLVGTLPVRTGLFGLRNRTCAGLRSSSCRYCLGRDRSHVFSRDASLLSRDASLFQRTRQRCARVNVLRGYAGGSCLLGCHASLHFGTACLFGCYAELCSSASCRYCIAI